MKLDKMGEVIPIQADLYPAGCRWISSKKKRCWIGLVRLTFWSIPLALPALPKEFLDLNRPRLVRHPGSGLYDGGAAMSGLYSPDAGQRLGAGCGWWPRKMRCSPTPTKFPTVQPKHGAEPGQKSVESLRKRRCTGKFCIAGLYRQPHDRRHDA